MVVSEKGFLPHLRRAARSAKSVSDGAGWSGPSASPCCPHSCQAVGTPAATGRGGRCTREARPGPSEQCRKSN